MKKSSLFIMQAKWAEAVGEELGLMRAAQANLEQDLAASGKENAQLLEDLQAARYLCPHITLAPFDMLAVPSCHGAAEQNFHNQHITFAGKATGCDAKSSCCWLHQKLAKGAGRCINACTISSQRLLT